MSPSNDARFAIEKVESYFASSDSKEETAGSSIQALISLYDRDPWRAYHTTRHLNEMIDFLKTYEDQLDDPVSVFGAVLGHDSVYEPWLYAKAGANEELSRERTRYFLTPYLSPPSASRVDVLIEATAHHRVNDQDTDLAYFLDADMHILGAEPERFSEYENDIFREFTWLGTVTRKQYLEGRLKFVRSVEGKQIFSTEIGQDLYEEQAHRNLAALALRHTNELNQAN